MGRKKKNDWKNRDGVVYSTGDFDYNYDNQNDQDTLSPEEQTLRVQLDKKARGGKKVTLITGFIGTDDDLKDLGKHLKNKCGVGGAAKDGEILIQGDHRSKIVQLFQQEGYQVKQVG